MDQKVLEPKNKSQGYFSRIFPALTHAPFRWFWGGQIISLIGTWTQNVGQAWLVLQLTNSPFLLGLVSALQFMPMLLLSLHAGVWIDRLPKRRILVVTQTTLMLLAFILAILVGTGIIRYWMLAILAIILGIANTLDVPARQSFVIEMVGREHLANAIALNSAIFNGARLIGPAIAGTIMGIWGATWCFIINGISFVGVILILAFLPIMPDSQKKSISTHSAVWPDIKEGLQYIRKTPLILLSILMIAVLSAVAMNFNVLVPVMAKIELHEQVLGFGLLMSAMGMGALLGAMMVAFLSGRASQLLLMFIGALGLGVFSILLGKQTQYMMAALMLAMMGWSMIIFAASANSLIQLKVDNKLRGRVMSVYSLVFGGMTPLGSFYAGTLAHFWGAGKTFFYSGWLVLAFLFLLLILHKRFTINFRLNRG